MKFKSRKQSSNVNSQPLWHWYVGYISGAFSLGISLLVIAPLALEGQWLKAGGLATGTGLLIGLTPPTRRGLFPQRDEASHQED